MMNLYGANDVLRLVTSSAANIDVTAGLVTRPSDGSAPAVKSGGRMSVAAAATTTIVAAPGAGNDRDVFSMVLRNRHASLANTLTLQLFDGTTAYEILKVTLAAGEQMIYDGLNGWVYMNAQGLPRVAQALGAQAPTSGIWLESALAADVVNANAVANSIADITGLSFPVLNALRYRFKFTIDWTSAAGTTGARFSINGPAFSRLSYQSRYGLTTTTETLNQLVAYDLPAAANANPANVGGNLAVIEGFIQPAADGNVIARFASEVASSAITAKAGSMVEWKQVA
jgi:hypothetical protein